MIKMYVMKTCPYCEYVEKQVKGNNQFEVIDISTHVRKLKEFLDLRDNNSAFDEAKKISATREAHKTTVQLNSSPCRHPVFPASFVKETVTPPIE